MKPGQGAQNPSPHPWLNRPCAFHRPNGCGIGGRRWGQTQNQADLPSTSASVCRIWIIADWRCSTASAHQPGAASMNTPSVNSLPGTLQPLVRMLCEADDEKSPRENQTLRNRRTRAFHNLQSAHLATAKGNGRHCPEFTHLCRVIDGAYAVNPPTAFNLDANGHSQQRACPNREFRRKTGETK
jgi:hypothetical protein